MELAHLPYKKGTYEDYVGERSLEKRGKKKWRRHVADVVERLTAALEPDDVVLGGGNVKKLKELPKGTRAGNNDNAFLGGFRLWEKADDQKRSPGAKTRTRRKRNAREQLVKVQKSVETKASEVIKKDRKLPEECKCTEFDFQHLAARGRFEFCMRISSSSDFGFLNKEHKHGSTNRATHRT